MIPHWAAVIGDPVRHSLSPRIFRSLHQKLGRRVDYVAVTVPPDRLKEAVIAARKRPWIGWNVTLPHKETILPLLDSIDASASAVGAVNVVRFLDGRCIGYNTDAEGFLSPLKKSGFEVSGKRAVVLGAGGASKAVLAALKEIGFREIEVFGRRQGNWSPSAVRDAVAQADLVVQATPLGMDSVTSPVDERQAWKHGALAYDLVYRPIETPFLRQARLAGAMTMGGLGMLLAQAVATWRIWFGQNVSMQVVLDVEDELRKVLE